MQATDELSAAQGVPVARDHLTHSRGTAHGGMISAMTAWNMTAWNIDIADNPLPGAWLAGILLAGSPEHHSDDELRDRTPHSAGPVRTRRGRVALLLRVVSPLPSVAYNDLFLASTATSEASTTIV